jgi:SAM-dependent methyltransferase
MEFSRDRIACRGCDQTYEYCGGFPDLVVGGRFEDEADDARTRYEEESNDYLTRNYLIPTFQRVLEAAPAARILSLGCGSGVDVDLMAGAGFDIVGIDCGNRTEVWPHRRERERLCLANGKHLPFESATFDAVYCGCVFPHVGVDGDSDRVRPDYWSQRSAIASEITRVLKPNGHVMVSSPNRLCPVDLFHGRNPSQPFPRVNPPWNPFLLSAGDYRRLFHEAGCGRATLLPITKYWGFIRMKQRLAGRVMAFPVEALFRMLSTSPLRGLRGSPVNPWLVMMAQKNAY